MRPGVIPFPSCSSKFSLLTAGLILSAFWMSACASLTSSSGPVLGGVDPAGNKIYFSDDKASIQKALKGYTSIYDISTPQGQTDYLIKRLETTRYRLERNGIQHTSSEAAEFLRWKMDRPRWKDKVSTVNDFVEIVCAGSVESGKPYIATLPDGSRRNLQAIFRNELEILEEYRSS